MLKTILKNIIKASPAIRFTDNKHDLYQPIITADDNLRLDNVFGRSVRIRQVDAGSCNACEWECIALSNPVYDASRFGIDFVASPRHADILLVTGPVSHSMVLALKQTFRATPDPKIVIGCGDCTIDGGIFKGSYAVTDGLSSVVPVAGFIPGCPPGPRDIAVGIQKILGNYIK